MTSEHDLLLRHFDTWARKTGRTPDIQLLDELLHLRSAYDELPATYWPAHSPARGAVACQRAGRDAGPEVVADTLEAFVRFLRNTGRMASGSAEPAALAKEARRSSKQMVELASDRANSRSQADWDSDSGSEWRALYYTATVEEVAGMWSDTGLYTEDADSITLTPFGDAFITAWLNYLEE